MSADADVMIENELTPDFLFSVMYEELRRRAAAVRRSEPSQTLSPTALVHEAYLKLSASPNLALQSREHFLAVATRVMRHLLIDAARQRLALRRGGGDALVTLDEELGGGVMRAEELVDLDEALERLATIDPRQAQVIEHRFFGGLTADETAAVLGVSVRQIGRELALAKGWIAMQLGRA